MIETGVVESLLKRLGYSDDEVSALIEQIIHFDGEAPNRDNIVMEYLGSECIERIVQEVVEPITVYFEPGSRLRILDLAAGSGTFTVRIRDKLASSGFNVDMYGLDISPGMLSELVKKGISGVWGVADRIRDSILLWREYLGSDAPLEYDVVFSTLALHHFHDPVAVFRSIREVLVDGGLVVVVGVLKHEFGELRDELKDVHLGFSIDEVVSMVNEVFSMVDARVIDDVYCRVGGYMVGLYRAVMK